MKVVKCCYWKKKRLSALTVMTTVKTVTLLDRLHGVTPEETNSQTNSPSPPLFPLLDINAEMKGVEAFKAAEEQNKGKKKKLWVHIFFGSKVFNFASWLHLDQSLPTAAIIRGQSLHVFVRAPVVITSVKVCSLPTFISFAAKKLPLLPGTEAVKEPVCKNFEESPTGSFKPGFL